MSNELKGAALLYALVLDNPGYCALSRACKGLGLVGQLDKLRERLGLTEPESLGVMVGWDDAVGKRAIANCVRSVSRPKNPEEFDRGYEIGKKAASLAGVAL